MKPTTIFRIGGFCAASCFALLGGPVAVAVAQPSEPNRPSVPHQNAASTAPAKATANPSLPPKGLKTVIEAGATHRLQLLEAQQAKLQQSGAKIEGAEQAKLAKEREAQLTAKTASDAAHLQATAKNQQMLQAVSGILAGTTGAPLHALSDATKQAQKADAAALEAQLTAYTAARTAGMQAEINAMTAELINLMAKIQQANIDIASHIARS